MQVTFDTGRATVRSICLSGSQRLTRDPPQWADQTSPSAPTISPSGTPAFIALRPGEGG